MVNKKPSRPSRKSAPKTNFRLLILPVLALLAVTGVLVWLLARADRPREAHLTPLGPSPVLTERPRRTPVLPLKKPDAMTPKPPAAAPLLAGGGAEIAIVLDDVGVDRRGAEGAIALPPQVTLAMMPYADDVAALAARARAAGHELLVHMPMEPVGGMNPGPNALLTGLEPDELRRRIDWNLSRFSGYVGVNNHMGSKFTADADGMKIVIAELKRRNLMFLDSRTTAQTKGAKLAAAEGEPFTERDVFLDNDQSDGNARAMLAEVEAKARAHGRAVAIGHPHATTLAALRAWIPQAEARGFRLVPVSALMSAENKPR